MKKHGKGTKICRRCGRRQGVIRKYGLWYCRKCFREIAKDIGFKKHG
jgi:small subunit ribosomal protein S14